MRRLPGYVSLIDACRMPTSKCPRVVMSLTGMVNVGKGSMVIGFASGAHAFKE